MRLSFALVTVTVVSMPCLASVIPRSVPASHIVLERHSHSPSQWMKRDRLDSEVQVEMRIALKPSGLDQAHDWLMDVADPTSPIYGKHWTAEQVWEAFKPSEDSVDAIRDWFIESGINDTRVRRTANHAWLKVSVSGAEMERLLHTSYHEFEHLDTGHRTLACDQYHIPEHLAAHIDYITPGVQRDRLRYHNGALEGSTSTVRRGRVQKRNSGSMPQRKTWSLPKLHLVDGYNGTVSHNVSNCDTLITPACIQALYQIHEPAPSPPNPNNSMGIYEEAGQTIAQQDLNLFFSAYAPWIPNGTHPINVAIDGGQYMINNVSDTGPEISLDLDMAYPIVYPQTITVYAENDLPEGGGPNETVTWLFEEMFDAFDGSYCTYEAYGQTGNPYGPTYPDPLPGGYKGQLQCGTIKTLPNLVSLSYGYYEKDLTIAFQKRQCNEFLKLGLQGISFIVASGDYGVSGFNPTAANEECLGSLKNAFSPSWPSNCPYITSVGGTKVPSGNTVYQPEVVVYDPATSSYPTNFSGGGGFTNLYPVPSYQQAAVATYFEQHAPPYQFYSKLANATTNTTYLDVKKLQDGNPYALFNRIGRGYPDVAANADNSACAAEGVLYVNAGTSQATPIFASIINRINEERLNANKAALGFLNPALYQNPAMLNDITIGHNVGCLTNGFAAVSGWDPVTGLGTPNFPKMKKYFLSLP